MSSNTFSQYSEMKTRANWLRLILIVLITALIASAGTAYVTTRILLSEKSAPGAAAISSAELATLNAHLKQVESALAQKDLPSVKATSPMALTISDVAGNGEGVENPFIRQMTANPTLVDFPVCRKKQTVKQQIGCNAQFLATNTGFAEWKFGEEMRVKAPNTVAFHIEKDASGNIQVAQYAVTIVNGAITGSSLVKTYRAAASVPASHFIGPMDGTTTFQTAHLYMYTG